MTEQPPGDPYGRPTEPLRPQDAPVAREEVVVDDYPMTKAELADRIDRTRFWSQFGAAAGTLAAILAVIGIVLALQAKDDADKANSGTSNAALRSEVNGLQDDVNSLQKQQQDTQQQVDDLDSSVTSLEKKVGSQSNQDFATTPAVRPAPAAGQGPERHRRPAPEGPRERQRRWRRRHAVVSDGASGRSFRLVALPGDGIGPEVVAAARRLLDAIGTASGAVFEVEELPVGGASIDAHGSPLLPEVLERCAGADAVLLGAVGGPKWDTTDPDAPRPEQGLLGLRKGLELFANLRPVRIVPALAAASPLRPERIEGADLLIVRELTGGIYFGDRGRRNGVAHDTLRVLRRRGRAHRARSHSGWPHHRQGAGWSPPSTRRTSSRPRVCGARRSSRSRATTPMSSSSTCWSTTPRCS